MAIATIQQAIDRGEVSVYLSANYNSNAALFPIRVIKPVSPLTIAMVTDALSWGYNDGSGSAQTDISLREVANYLIWLIGMFGQQAEAILGSTGGGSTVVPGGSSNDSGLFPIVITDEDMVDGTIYNNPLIVGKNIMLWVSRYSQEWEIAPDFFIYTATGFQIVRADFDAADYRFIRIDKFNSADSAFSPSITIPPIVVEYDLVADDTLIANLSNITTAGQPVIIDIKANGFTYNWDTMFEFSDTLPEQPTATTDGTHQIYSFSYIPSLTKLTIVSESLNVEI
jgi:hypothetical protein